jgi:hypothetical protein
VDVVASNRSAWDHEVQSGNPWTMPVSAAVIAAARDGRWDVLLTEGMAALQHWFPPPDDADVLCLAAGGAEGTSFERCTKVSR